MKRFAVIIFLLLGTALFAKAQAFKPVLSAETAAAIIKGAVAYADSNRLGMAVAVYDVGGQLIAFYKMDGASAGAAEVARWKGRSAALYQFPTSETAKWKVPEAPGIATVPGGLPIRTKDGMVIGGVGVSGAAAETDAKCAAAGLTAAGLPAQLQY